VTGLTDDTVYWIVLTVTDDSDQESGDSNEVNASPEGAAAADGFVGTRTLVTNNYEGVKQDNDNPIYSPFTADTTGSVSYVYLRMRHVIDPTLTRAVIWDSGGDTLAVSTCSTDTMYAGAENVFKFTLNNAVSVTEGSTYNIGIITTTDGWQLWSNNSAGDLYVGSHTPSGSCPTYADFSLDTIGAGSSSSGTLCVWASNYGNEDGQ